MIIKKSIVAGLALAILANAASALAFVQFPYDIDNMPYGNFPGPEDVDWNNNGTFNGPANFNGTTVPVAVYKHLSAGDGYIKMADSRDMYIFGFGDGTGVPAANFMMDRELGADFTAPTLDMYEGQQYYLTITNVGMKIRPDLFDPHTVHFHGFPQAATVFDGEPMASFGVRMMSDLTYYYNIVEPGTYMYHCHVEATEHMEMGMLGNLVVRPRQDLYVQKNFPGGITWNGRSYTKFAYNDCDNLPEYAVNAANEIVAPYDFVSNAVAPAGGMCGASGYDVEATLQFSEFDPAFHDADENAQPLPFADFESRYFMLNGRGYPDTVNTGVINNQNGYPAQKHSSKIVASQGQTILVRLSNLSVQNFATIEIMGIPAKVIGKCAKLLRGPDGKDLSYYANSVFIGPGESFDLLINTTGVPPGTYYLYSRNLPQLNNDLMERGGAMTEIIVQP